MHALAAITAVVGNQSLDRKVDFPDQHALGIGVISLEDAIRSSTSLPAQIMGLRDRGQLREGYAADIVILDPNTIRDRSTFFEPHQYPEGINYVLINGTFVVDGGKPTQQLPGRVLTRGTAGTASDGAETR
jgi:N-acyl-D-aspartate/D-glutamate deacylase